MLDRGFFCLGGIGASSNSDNTATGSRVIIWSSWASFVYSRILMGTIFTTRGGGIFIGWAELSMSGGFMVSLGVAAS